MAVSKRMLSGPPAKTLEDAVGACDPYAPECCGQRGAGKAARAATSADERRLTVDELLAARLTPPPGVGPISLEGMTVFRW